MLFDDKAELQRNLLKLYCCSWRSLNSTSTSENRASVSATRVVHLEDLARKFLERE